MTGVLIIASIFLVFCALIHLNNVRLAKKHPELVDQLKACRTSSKVIAGSASLRHMSSVRSSTASRRLSGRA